MITADNLVKHALHAFREGDVKTARDAFEAARRAAPERVDVLRLYAAFASDLGAFSVSAELLEQATKSDPSKECLFALARAQLKLRQIGRAQAVARKMAAQYPSCPEGHLILGYIAALRGSVSEAREHLAKARNLGGEAQDLEDAITLRCIWDHIYVEINDIPSALPYQHTGYLTENECNLLMEYLERQCPLEGRIGGARKDSLVRNSEVTWLRPTYEITDVYTKIYRLFMEHWAALELDEVEPIQLASYTASSGGHYTWHTDTAARNDGAARRLSISVQLSNANDYEGGHLEIETPSRLFTAHREQGTAILFASTYMHRVTPITKCRRCSLVAWGLAPHSSQSETFIYFGSNG